MLALKLALLASLPLFGTTAVSAASCEDKASCSPAQCVKNVESDCALSIPKPDFPTAVSSLGCKVCNQSTASVCENLAAKFRTDGHVKAAWCNDAFLVVVSDGLPSYDAASPSYLGGIPLPPGGDAGCRVRTAAEQLLVFKVPVAPQKLAAGASNTVPNPLPKITGMPAAGAVAVAIDGVPVFPNYNNRGLFSWVSCELDRCNAHGGKGADYHYHGDPYGSKCLYSGTNYTSTHPIIIAFSLDGYLVYGRYTESSQDGQFVALDKCGGHEHGSFGYHYHPEVRSFTTSSLDGASLSGSAAYTAYLGAPMECWAGDIGQILNFWTATGHQVNYDSTKDGLSGRNDKKQLQPCCGMSDYYAAADIVPPSSPSPSPSTSPSPSPGPSGTLGTCSGTDDKGKACPSNYDAARPCPPGCTSTLSSGSLSPSPTPSPSPSPGPSGAFGTCSGTDDTGKTCPSEYDAATPCPLGCTSTPSSGIITYTYATGNTQSYMCPAGNSTAGLTVACGQGEYPAGLNDGPTVRLSCGSLTVQCFLFASIGNVGGRCTGDPFQENPDNRFAFMPTSVANSCLGESSCSMTMSDGAINGVSTSPSTAGYVVSKFKVLALCTSSAGAMSTSTARGPGISRLVLHIYMVMAFFTLQCSPTSE